jgi:hypothetical protein
MPGVIAAIVIIATIVFVIAVIWYFMTPNGEKLLMESEYQGAMQRHHNYYVRLFRKLGDTIDPGDRRNYDLAMQREKDGEVKPLIK